MHLNSKGDCFYLLRRIKGRVPSTAISHRGRCLRQSLAEASSTPWLLLPEYAKNLPALTRGRRREVSDRVR